MAVFSSLAALLLAGTAVRAQAAPSSSPVHVINLHRAYMRALPDVRLGRISGVVPPLYALGTRTSVGVLGGVGLHVGGASTVSGSLCTEPDCPLVYHGGPVQHSPHVYLLLWGPTWSSNAGEEASAAYLESFYSGLGVQPQDTWSTTNSQYSDGSGYPVFNGSVYMGVWQDTTTPPTGVGQSGLAAEADAFAAAHNITDLADAQIIIATQSGTCPAGFYSSSCNGGSGSYCAWHSVSKEPYTNLPYLLDAGTGCGEGFVNSPGTNDGWSIVGGHEYAETVTDPVPNTGWYDSADSVSGGEIGDKCAWGGESWGGSDPSGNVVLSTGSFAMQSLWSNAANGCVMATNVTPPTTTIKLTPSSPNGTNGWYTENVNVQISATDPGDTVSETRCTLDPATVPSSFSDLPSTPCPYLGAGVGVTTNGTHTVYAASVDSNGFVESVHSASFKIDETPPSVSGSPTTAPNGNGWYDSAVTIHWLCSDPTSGVASCPSDSTISSEGTDETASSGTAYDNAGNSNSATSSPGVNIDKTPPTVTVTGVTDGAVYTVGGVPTAGCSTTDALSGVQTDATLSTSGGPVGAVTVTCSGGEDNAGNVADSVSATYSVGYSFSGFLAPISDPSTLNNGYVGMTYPVKWQLTDANGNFISDLSAVSTLKYTYTGAICRSSNSTGSHDTRAAGSTSLHYNPTTNHYVYEWRTPSAKGCYTLFLNLSDGNTYYAYFHLKAKECVVPKVEGRGLRAAKRAIRAHDCLVGKIEHAFSTKVKKGHVTSQKPKPHKRLRHDAKVSLIVSKGKH